VALVLRSFRLEIDLTCSQWPLVLLGPSGAGKSAFLRTVAGLSAPQEGSISFGARDEVWFDASSGAMVPSHRRRIGYCQQDPLLFPHLRVWENVAYPLNGRRPRLGRRERRDLARAELSAWGVEALADARVDEISGGEQARVALARAFAPRPQLLLLDEPFASLDPPTREALMEKAQSILRERGTPAVWVTHDREEALTLGRTMAVVQNGRVAQTGVPEEIFRRPASPEVAAFVGLGTVWHGIVQAREAGVMRVRCASLVLRATGGLAPGTPVVTFIRSEDVELLPLSAPAGEADAPASARPAVAAAARAPGGEDPRKGGMRGSARNEIPATVVSLRPQGLQVIVDLDAGHPLAATLTKASVWELGLKPGLPVLARIKAVAVRVRTEVWS